MTALGLVVVLSWEWPERPTSLDMRSEATAPAARQTVLQIRIL